MAGMVAGTRTRPAEKYNFVFLGFGGLKSTKSRYQEVQKVPLSYYGIILTVTTPQMI
jgi:hypothetical protein